MKKTYQKPKEEVKRSWHLKDADNKVLGRLASEITQYLMGKHKVDYTPHTDMGDYVVVTNAQKVKLTGRKDKQKVYYKHSGYPKGFREIKVEKLRDEQPEKIIAWAVKRMLPDNRLRDPRMARLKIFAKENHTFEKELKNGKEK